MYQLHAGPGSSHSILARLVLKAGRSPVLDVGAAEGYLGRLLQASGLVIDAVEPDRAYAEAAAPFYRRLYSVPVEDLDIVETYGAIVFGDVLEHLLKPEAVLKTLVGHLQPDGVVLVSLPNAVHMAVRLMLLSGRFPRMNRGILDRTHLHFFTRVSSVELLESAGLCVLEAHPSVVPLPDIAAGTRWSGVAKAVHPVQLLAARLFPEVFAYQWVFLARPSQPSTQGIRG